jgi:hypothetical protein
MMDDFFQDAVDNDGGGGGDEDAAVMDPGCGAYGGNS